jgi:hypothetical protein
VRATNSSSPWSARAEAKPVLEEQRSRGAEEQKKCAVGSSALLLFGSSPGAIGKSRRRTEARAAFMASAVPPDGASR